MAKTKVRPSTERSRPRLQQLLCYFGFHNWMRPQEFEPIINCEHCPVSQGDPKGILVPIDKRRRE
jgi:hypothetical protein